MIQAIQKGSQEGFKHFFGQHYKALCAFALGQVQDANLAEDIAQEVFISFWKKRTEFNDEAGAKSYLYTSVKNKCINHFKHAKVVQMHVQSNQRAEYDVHYDLGVIEEDTFNILFQAIKTLPPSAQKIMLLALYGLKNPQIAEKLSISLNTVKTQKKIAYSKLKDTISPFSLLILFSA